MSHSIVQVWRKVPKMEREQWLQWRRTGIGGSDAAAILGASPWSTPYQVWMEKVHGYEEKQNYAMKVGTETEENSRMEIERIKKESFFPLNVENIETPWAKASLDGINLEGNKVIEIKKAGKQDQLLAKEGKIPNKYFPQCQHILRVLELPVLYYCSVSFEDSSLIIVEVPRDEEYIKNTLCPSQEQFWEMVVTKRPPPMTVKDKKKFLV